MVRFGKSLSVISAFFFMLNLQCFAQASEVFPVADGLISTSSVTETYDGFSRSAETAASETQAFADSENIAGLYEFDDIMDDIYSDDAFDIFFLDKIYTPVASSGNTARTYRDFRISRHQVSFDLFQLPEWHAVYVERASFIYCASIPVPAWGSMEYIKTSAGRSP